MVVRGVAGRGAAKDVVAGRGAAENVAVNGRADNNTAGVFIKTALSST